METIRVLLLEDHEGEARLNQRLLERSYTTEYAFSSIRTLEHALAAIAAETFDVALLDLNVPDSKGMDTYLTVQAAAPDLPVVIISAVADENLAQSAIRHGAQDYLVKGGITSEDLRRVVRYAIARKEAESTAGRVRMRHVPPDLPPTAAFRLDAEGNISVVSSDMAALLREPDASALLGHPLSTFFPPKDAARVDETVRRILRDGSGDLLLVAAPAGGTADAAEGVAPRLLLSLEALPGESTDAGSAAHQRGAAQGTIMRAPAGAAPDREAEEANRRYRTLVEHSQDGVFVLADEKILYANKTFADILGYDIGELNGMPISRLVAPEDAPDVLEKHRRRIEGEDVEESYELSALRRDGSRVRVLLSVGRLDQDSGVELLGTLKDVSETRRTAYVQQLQHRLAVAFAQAQGRVELFDVLLQGLLRIEGIDQAAVFVVDEGGGSYRLARWKGLQGPFPSQDGNDSFTQMHDRLVRESAPRYFQFDELTRHALSGQLSPSGVRCYGIIPLIHGEQRLGAIDIASLTQDHIDTDITNALEFIASTFGGVLARVLAEDARNQSEELYRALVEKSHDTIFIFRDDRIIFANEKTRLLTGYGSDELLSMNPWTLVHPDDRARIQSIATRRSAGEEVPMLYEGRILTRDGTIRIGEFAATMIRYDGASAALVTVRDITSRKTQEEELRRSDELIRAAGFAAARFLRAEDWEEGIMPVLERLGSAANVCRVVIFEIVTDSDGVRRMRQRAVWVRAEMRDSVMERVPDGDSLDERPFLRWAEEFRAGRAVSGVIDHLPDEEQISLARQNVRSLVALPVFSGGDCWGFIRFDECRIRRTWLRSEIEAMAVSAETLGAAIRRKQGEQDLLASRERALQAEAIKNAFIANISHEVRTPLNIILGYLVLVAEMVRAEESEELREYVDAIDDASRRLMRTVDSIMNISRFQTRDLTLQRVPLRLDKLLRELADRYRHAIEEKGLVCLVDNALGAVEVSGDHQFLGEAFEHLIENAVKFTASGEIRIRLAAAEDGRPKVEIEDTGIGISAEFLDKVFDPYLQEDIGYNRHYEGVGLGLTLVRLYLRAHGAELSIDSEKGRGTRVRVTFPGEET